MQATLTEIHRNTKKVFRNAQSGARVQVTDYGKTIARITPDYPTITLTAEEFRALPISEDELNKAINEALADIRA